MKTSRGGHDMKRYGNIYSKIYDMNNLRLAHKNARKDKLFYREVKMVDSDEDYYLGQIQKMLINKTYNVSEYTISTINDKGKNRELTDKYMKDNFNTAYCLKIDISKFYPNINHKILKNLLKKKFKDKDLLEILFKIVDSTPGNKGVPIGSYLSQYLANFYLSYFDHWLKEKMGMKCVVRYMDDIVVFHYSCSYLHWLKIQMDEYLASELDLKIKPNWQVFPTAIRGVDFVGFRHFYGYKLLRKSTCKKFKKKMLLIRKKKESGRMINYSEWCSANSYNGWLKWCDSYRLRKKYVEPIQSSLDSYYQKVIKERKVA